MGKEKKVEQTFSISNSDADRMLGLERQLNTAKIALANKVIARIAALRDEELEADKVSNLNNLYEAEAKRIVNSLGINPESDPSVTWVLSLQDRTVIGKKAK